jgi:hypothetical protein
VQSHFILSETGRPHLKAFAHLDQQSYCNSNASLGDSFLQVTVKQVPNKKCALQKHSLETNCISNVKSGHGRNWNQVPGSGARRHQPKKRSRITPNFTVPHPVRPRHRPKHLTYSEHIRHPGPCHIQDRRALQEVQNDNKHRDNPDRKDKILTKCAVLSQLRLRDVLLLTLATTLSFTAGQKARWDSSWGYQCDTRLGNNLEWK